MSGKATLASDVLHYGKFAVDVTDPREPGVIATNSVLGFDALSETRAIALEGSTLQSFRLDGAGAALLLGTANLLELPNYSPAGPFSGAILGDYGFVGAGPAGLVIFDLRSDNPTAVLQVAVSESVISVSGSGNRLAVTGSRLEGNTCCISAVRLFDVGNPLAPELLAECNSITNAANFPAGCSRTKTPGRVLFPSDEVNIRRGECPPNSGGFLPRIDGELGWPN